MIHYRKKTTIVAIIAATTLAVGVTVATVPALASDIPFHPSLIVLGVFDPFDVKAEKSDKWKFAIKSQGQTDLRVTSVVWAVGGSSGWHSHPGPNLLTVKRGSVTEYEGSDPVCPNRTYNVGDTFGDNGGSAVHLVRNAGNVEAEVIAVAFYPKGAQGTVGKTRPTNCATLAPAQ